ncbi:MAG: hypothetical protein WCB31_07895 [Nitrososphaeraceae archaeon]
MTDKTQIIRELGMRELLLPTLISDALDANDRVKYFLSLVQMAKHHADNPQIELSNLRKEREECRIGNNSLDRVVEYSTKKPDLENYYYIPNVNSIVNNIIENINQMILPLQTFFDTADQKRTHDSNVNTNSNADQKAEYDSLFSRLKDLLAVIPRIDEDIISGLLIDSFISGERKNRDSFHLVVMGIHKELNRLQSLIYQESIDGAKVYGITDNDRISIRAFMKGINKSKKLKFEHPGLDTTATRSGDILLIQNNIGTTDAHVLVIKIKEMTVSVTYSDTHIQRLIFFHSMLDTFHVNWENTASKQSEKFEGSGLYHVTNGTYIAKNQTDLESYLSFLASRIVFLIDWNRARKGLGRFVKKEDVFSILKWAADNDLGHMGFLKMGGQQLIFEAIKKNAKSSLQFGDDFQEILSREKAIEFLKFVLKTCAEGLIQGKSEFLIRDEVRVQLSKNFRSIDETLLNMASNHASLVVEISNTVRDGLVQIESDDQEFITRNAERSKIWEKNADALLNNIRVIARRSNASVIFEKFVGNADDAADSMEETLFLLTLVSKQEIIGDFYEPLLDLAELAAHSSMEYLKAIENAKIVDKWSSHEEIDDFLQTIDKIITIEHQADDVIRQVKAAIMSDSNNFKQLHVLSEISKNIEEVTDSLMKSVVILRDYIMEVLAI